MNLLCGLSGIAGIKNPKKGLCNIFEAGYENILLDYFYITWSVIAFFVYTILNTFIMLHFRRIRVDWKREY